MKHHQDNPCDIALKQALEQDFNTFKIKYKSYNLGNVQTANLPSRNLMVAIIWVARNANFNFAGYAWVNTLLIILNITIV